MCEKCECAHAHDYGACDEFEEGMNGRCVYCDHDEGCHPGSGEYANGPLWPIRKDWGFWVDVDGAPVHISGDRNMPDETLEALKNMARAARKAAEEGAFDERKDT